MTVEEQKAKLLRQEIMMLEALMAKEACFERWARVHEAMKLYCEAYQELELLSGERKEN